jgi:hypothetical protein
MKTINGTLGPIEMRPYGLTAKGVKLTAREVAALCLKFGYDDLAHKIHEDTPDKHFTSDGASGFPDEVGAVDIYPATFWHDVDYWAGRKSDLAGRLVSDCRLAINVVEMCNGPAALAELVFNGVRFGGSGYMSTPWRWGFGRK